MSRPFEETKDHHDAATEVTSTPFDEKKGIHDGTQVTVQPPDSTDIVEVSKDLGATIDDLVDLGDKLETMSMEKCRAILIQVRRMHRYDQNFPVDTLNKINAFLENDDVFQHPEKHQELVNEMKLEALMVTENSPYAMVRAVVDPTDEPEMPSLTFRVWFIGTLFAGIGSFINELFTVRQPSISVNSSVAQLLAFPAGKLLEKTLPKREFSMFGRRFSLNPGPFNKKEHMLITIMATVAFNNPYTGNIVLSQALPMYFNQAYARKFSYQILNTLGSNFIGYGIAGLCRRFVVYPSHCVWPSSLATLALNKAFHADDTRAVPGPFKRMYSWSRMRLFLVAFIAMFVFYWFPNYIFQGLAYFSWMSWIKPDNVHLATVTGTLKGLGVNPIPTFDWSIISYNGALLYPLFAQTNQLIGAVISMFMILGIWYGNKWNTAYLPLNDNHTWNNKGKTYNVSKILNKEGLFDEEKYQQYSEPWMAAANLMVYFWFFAVYTAAISYTALYHRAEIAAGFRSAWKSIRRVRSRGAAAEEDDTDLSSDVHNRLMKRYPEVSEIWYMLVLLAAAAFGIAGLAAFPTNTSPAVAIYGLLLAFIFVIPISLIASITGNEITLNVLAEFIGGLISPGNAVALNYFKMYGYITTSSAVRFCSDLKLAHYTKIPPRHTFVVQIVATLVATFVSVALFNFQLGLPGICTPEATFRFTCPGINTFFTAAVFWGTLGPAKLFGANGRYKVLLVGLPVGFLLPFIFWGLQRAFPRQRWLRSIHPVMLANGPLVFAPYNLAYIYPGWLLTFISWKLIKSRYLDFWGRYNFVLAAAFTTAIAISALVMFFGLAIPKKDIDWWGNNIAGAGCDSGCPLLPLPEKGYYGADPGTFK